jgi:signal transduction histidine kinase
VSITALRDVDNAILGYLLIGADYTAAQLATASAARAKLAQEILNQERQRLDRLKDEFVSTVSHELRTPLTSISASISLLVGGAATALPPPAARLLAIAQSRRCSSRRLRAIGVLPTSMGYRFGSLRDPLLAKCKPIPTVLPRS